MKNSFMGMSVFLMWVITALPNGDHLICFCFTIKTIWKTNRKNENCKIHCTHETVKKIHEPVMWIDYSMVIMVSSIKSVMMNLEL